MQYSFDPLDHEGTKEEQIKAAKAERQKAMKEWQREGYGTRRWVLKGQLKKYAGLGQEDGRVRDVYMLDIWKLG